jgi:hypothetical protein
VTLLPAAVKNGLVSHLDVVREQHRRDVANGAGWVELPAALARKYPAAEGSGPGSGFSQPPGPTETR